MKNKIPKIEALLILILILSGTAFSQIVVKDLEISLRPAPANMTESVEQNGRRLQVTIKNVSESPVSFENLKIYLEGVEGTVIVRKSKSYPQLSGKAENNCIERICGFAFAPPLKVKVLKQHQSTTVDIDLSLLHWYPGGPVSYYAPGSTKNLFDQLGTGQFWATVGVDILSNKPELKNQTHRASSDHMKVIL